MQNGNLVVVKKLEITYFNSINQKLIKMMENKIKGMKALMLLAAAAFLVSCGGGGAGGGDPVVDREYSGDGDDLERVKQEMVAPPMVPEHDQVAKGGPKVVEVEFEIQEKKMEIAPGDSIWAMTFNGSVPGPLIVVHEGDFVELTLKNPETNSLEHNIDFHAATGMMGGGDISIVSPGEQVTFRFRAHRAGTFVYHCAPGGMMTPMHVVSGMNGAIMVLPREGLKDEVGNLVEYDKAYYVVEQDYYLPKDEDGKYKNIATANESMIEMEKSIRTLIPSHIVFNGRRNSLTGKNALTAKVGEKVLFISAQANRDTRMHLIGGHADLYWPLGKFHNKPYVDLETWNIPGGSAGAALYKFREPGDYTFVNHNLIEAIAFGAFAVVKVEGEWDDALMKEVSKAGPIQN